MVKIGSIVLDVPFLQAAIAGYSDIAMRGLARRFGCPLTFAGVMIDTSAAHPVIMRKLGFRPAPNEHPVGGQIVGTEPGNMIKAAHALVDAGYDLVDLNFACPAPKVLRRGRGGEMLTDPAGVIEIFRRVRDAVKCPVTMKLRVGYDESEASKEDFWRIVETVAGDNIDALIIHGRTVNQYYRGKADWQKIIEVKKRFPHITVFGSGDIFSPETILERLGQGIDGVAIARGAIGNPWIFASTRALLEGKPKPQHPSIEEQEDIMLNHFHEVETIHGKAKAIGYFRKFSCHYCKFHPEKKYVHTDLMAAKSSEQFLAAVKKWYHS